MPYSHNMTFMDELNQTSSHRILVVDDNPSIHEDFHKILCPERLASSAAAAKLAAEFFDEGTPSREAPPFEMDSAFQGQEALQEKVQKAEQEGRPYSLAFMDVRMPPGWDGIETIHRIWTQYPHVQVVICTAYSDYSWEEILRKLGETDSMVILKKPFDNVEVLQLAHALTRKWSLTRQANSRLADLDEMVRQRTQELSQANAHLQKEIQRRALVEGTLRESEERFHKAFETVPIALAIRPLSTGLYMDVNQSFTSLTGFSKDELFGRSPEDLSLVAAPEQHARLMKSVRNGLDVRNEHLDIRRRDGQLRHTIVSMELFRLGEQVCLLAAFLDVTEQKQLEDQIHQSQKMEAVGQLAAGIAHDFNNLLTVIHGYASLQLAKTALDADVAKAFTQVKLASERASSLTRQLLAFSRKQVVQRKPLDVGSTVTRMQQMLTRVMGETIHLQCRNAPALPHISGDESGLEQIILNLSVNARDAMPSGGRLQLTTESLTVTAEQAAGNPDKHEGEFVVLTVSDTGCGMDAQTLGRIFEPFFTTKPIGRGTGLGLSTVHGIVKQHQGWIEVQSTVGSGTTFRVFLPAIPVRPEPSHQGTSAPAAAKPSAPQAPAGAILVVEDEEDIRQLICSALTRNGYQVLQAASGAEALLRWKEFNCKVRLLLTDLGMPEGISGSALAQHLLRRAPDLKVIYTSGDTPEAAASGDPLVDGLNFLAKPFSQERLLETVRNALSAAPAGAELAVST